MFNSVTYPHLEVLRTDSMFSCVSTTPFGIPVVPLEHIIAAVWSLSFTSSGWKQDDLCCRKLTKGVCLCENGNPKVTISFTNPTSRATWSMCFCTLSEQNIMCGLDILTLCSSSPADITVVWLQVRNCELCLYRSADKSLALPTSRCILFDG